jgi:hypothetical protein
LAISAKAAAKLVERSKDNLISKDLSEPLTRRKRKNLVERLAAVELNVDSHRIIRG